MAVEINKLLDLICEKDASDLHLTVGRPPTIRLHGDLISVNIPELTGDDTVRMMKSITSEKHQQELQEQSGGRKAGRRDAIGDGEHGREQGRLVKHALVGPPGSRHAQRLLVVDEGVGDRPEVERIVAVGGRHDQVAARRRGIQDRGRQQSH